MNSYRIYFLAGSFLLSFLLLFVSIVAQFDVFSILNWRESSKKRIAILSPMVIKPLEDLQDGFVDIEGAKSETKQLHHYLLHTNYLQDL